MRIDRDNSIEKGNPHIMNIVIDCRVLSTSYHFGLSRYCAGITSALSRLTPVTAIINDHRQLKHLPKDIDYMVAPALGLHTQRQVTQALNRSGADVVFSPTHFTAIGKRRFKVITSLHDTIGFDAPRQFAPDTPVHHRLIWGSFHSSSSPQRAILNRADHVITVSDEAKKSILAHRLTHRPVSVVYNAPFAAPVVDYHGGTTLVYIGSFFAYKQVELLVAALEFLPEYRLVCVSKASAKTQKAIRKHLTNQAQLEFLNGASDEEIAQLMQHTAALVTASTHEGFGLPVVEAQAMGVPVVISDIPIFHEVCQPESALFFDPHSPEAFARAVRKLPANASKLIAAGHKNAARFSWDASAKKLLEVITDVYQQKDNPPKPGSRVRTKSYRPRTNPGPIAPCEERKG